MGTTIKDNGYRSEVAGSVQETMSDAHDTGVVSRATLRAFDEACFAPVPTLAGEEIHAFQEREHVSQPVFAAYLNVSRNLVSNWERGRETAGWAGVAANFHHPAQRFTSSCLTSSVS